LPRHHEQNAARLFQTYRQLDRSFGDRCVLAGEQCRRLLPALAVEISSDDAKAVALKIERQVAAHHTQADDGD
jgi:hypothetical protein